MLNAIAWSAKVDVPKEGVEAKFYSHEEIDKVLGPMPDAKQNPATGPSPKREGEKDEKPIRTLLFAGNDKHKWHNWERTTPAIKEALERDPRIKVDVSLDIDDLGRKNLADYQVIVQNYCNWQDPKALSEKAQKAFVKFLAEGGGLVVIHFANGAFHYSLPMAKESDWPEYRKIVRRVWNHTPKEGEPKSGHDAFGKFTVLPTNVKHPIVDGLKPFEVIDELYFNQNGDDAVEPLLVAESKMTKKKEPLAFTYAFGKGRVFQTLLGHSEKTYDAFEAREILRRATAWCANREVRITEKMP
jgi:type 1 glutamine amidotransferase